MLINVDKHHEEFLCKCLKELSKHDVTDKDCLLFIASCGDELIIIDDNCDPDDMSLIATRLNTQATLDYMSEVFAQMRASEEKETECDE